MELVAFIGSDTENWGQITGLINHGQWSKIILIKNEAGKSYPSPPEAEVIQIDSTKKITDLKDHLVEKLKDKFAEFDVHVSLASGNGKEHMSLISALLGVPVGIRLVVFTKTGIEVLN